ncbi:MAG: methanol utilization protein MoxY [Methylibium sp. NZG]|nr:MAG: methanol utilization protein MoxY [Methylibium sp. NZG]
MSLRLKINLIVGVLTLLFVAIITALHVRGLRDSVHEEVASANRVAIQMLNRTVWRYAAQGPQAMLAFLEGMGRVRSNDITLLDDAGAELYRSPPSPYKAGREAPAWFSTLLAPPPAINSIKFPGGRLEVQANASRAVLDAWDGSVLLGAGAGALLLAVNALVFWLVGHTVRPFGQIVQGLNQLQAGRFDVTLPPLPGTEAAAMGTAFNRMVGVLQQNIENERRAGRAERELSDSRELTRWIDHHVEQERLMIARELHDELGQSVTAMRSMALSIAQRVAPLDAQAESAARLIADESSRLYDAMHGIIPRLTPLVLDNFGLAEALNDLAERTRRSHADVNIALQVDLGPARLPADAALALYRAAQEGITNALRHGQARQLQLTVRGQQNEVRLTLTDDGQGLAHDWAERAGHYGLRWLTERIEGLGGSFHLAAAAPRGVSLDVHIPLAAVNAARPTETAHAAQATTPATPAQVTA